MTPERALVERVKEMVWKWGQRPDEDGRLPWKESERAAYFDFLDTQEQVADIAAFAAEYAREQVESLSESRAVLADRLRTAQAQIAVMNESMNARLIRAMTAEDERNALRAENDRLTLAASESARTLQVEIEQMKAESVCWETGHTAEMGARLLRVHCPMCTDAAIKTIQQERDALKAQVTALREALKGVMALIDEDRLIRNTTNDSHFPSYRDEAIRLVKTLANAQELLAALPQDGA